MCNPNPDELHHFACHIDRIRALHPHLIRKSHRLFPGSENTFYKLTDGKRMKNRIATIRQWTRDFSTGIMNFDSIGVTTSSQIHRNLNLGLTFNTYYRLGKTAHLGLIYQPSFVPLRGDPAIIYEHLISLEINWRIKLLKSVSK